MGRKNAGWRIHRVLCDDVRPTRFRRGLRGVWDDTKPASRGMMISLLLVGHLGVVYHLLRGGCKAEEQGLGTGGWGLGGRYPSAVPPSGAPSPHGRGLDFLFWRADGTPKVVPFLPAPQGRRRSRALSQKQKGGHEARPAQIRRDQPVTAYSTARGFAMRFEAWRISRPTTLPSWS